VYKEPALPSLPKAGSKIIDPTFGTTILRLTDGADGSSDVQVRYSYWPTFNQDSTRLYVMGTYSGSNRILFYDFDPATMTASNKFTPSNPPGSGLAKDLIWSGNDPNVTYSYDYANKLWSYNVATKSYTLVKDFSRDVIAGGGLKQMSKSLNDDVFAFTLTNGSSDDGYIVWKRSTNQVLKRVLVANLDETQIDKTGRYLSVVFDSPINGNVDIWDLQSNTKTSLAYGSGGFVHHDSGHGTLLSLGSGSELRYRQLSTPNTWTSILPGYFGTGTQDTHYSMLADNESWALVSRFHKSGGTVANAFDNEITQVATDGSGQVRRLAHHRSVVNDYKDSPRANISRDGRFVAFTSNWGNANGRRDVYIVQAPPA
jgi:hypothetical protein